MVVGPWTAREMQAAVQSGVAVSTDVAADQARFVVVIDLACSPQSTAVAHRTELAHQPTSRLCLLIPLSRSCMAGPVLRCEWASISRTDCGNIGPRLIQPRQCSDPAHHGRARALLAGQSSAAPANAPSSTGRSDAGTPRRPGHPSRSHTCRHPADGTVRGRPAAPRRAALTSGTTTDRTCRRWRVPR